MLPCRSVSLTLTWSAPSPMKFLRGQLSDWQFICPVRSFYARPRTYNRQCVIVWQVNHSFSALLIDASCSQWNFKSSNILFLSVLHALGMEIMQMYVVVVVCILFFEAVHLSICFWFLALLLCPFFKKRFLLENVFCVNFQLYCLVFWTWTT